MLVDVKRVELTLDNVNTLVTVIDNRMRELRMLYEKETKPASKNHITREYMRLKCVLSKIGNTDFELIDTDAEV